MTVTTEELKQIKEKGFAYFGGTKTKTYWTPDGREVHSIPAMRTYIKKKEGKIIEDGIRDANLDNGWLVEKPSNPKPHCPHCDKWHDSLKEIKACGAKKQAFDLKWAEKARKEYAKEHIDKDVEISELKNQIAELSKTVEKLINGFNQKLS